MKRIFSILAAAAMLIILPSCRFIHVSDEVKQQIKNQGTDFGSGQNGKTITASDIIASREEAPGDFSTFTCSVPGDVTYLPGECSVSFSGPDNVLEHLLVSKEGEHLTIRSDGTRFRKVKNLKITLMAPEITSMEFNGAVDFEAPQGISASKFSTIINGAGDLDISGLTTGDASITVNGAGDITVSSLECKNLTVSINGAGDVTVSGRTQNADMSIHGAGDIDASELVADEFNTKIQGAGDIRKPKKQ